MGQYLCIGICNKITLRKNSSCEGISIKRIEESLMKNFEIEMYDYEELEGYYIWKLKPQYLEKEKIVEFIKEFYNDYEENENEKMILEELLSEFDKINSYEELIEFYENRRSVGFNKGEFGEYITFVNSYKDAYFHLENIILSMDGKIVMECYNNILKFLEKSVKNKYQKYDLSKVLRILIG